MTTEVAILGCGPAGLLAAHAARLVGKDFVIYSRNVKSTLGGAQYMHKRIPELCEEQPDAIINHVVRGDAETYQKKVYGETNFPGFVSFSNVYDGMREPAWNLRRLYERLWSEFEGDILHHSSLGPNELAQIVESHPTVLSTIPRNALCRGLNDPDIHHTFRQQQVLINDKCHSELPPDNTIIYDGTQERSWYRMSRLWGIEGTEWSADAPVPPNRMVRVSKPISAVCDCFPSVTRLGRYGLWQKGVLTHDSFFAALAVMS